MLVSFVIADQFPLLKQVSGSLMPGTTVRFLEVALRRTFPPSVPALLSLVVPVFGMLSLVGCGEPDPLNRQAIAGTVTLDGQPLEGGAISFSPTDGTLGGGAAIVQGEYAVPAEKGLPPGKYVVRINAASESGGDPTAPPGEVTPAKELVPASWNSQSTHEIEVVAGGDNQFPFDIKSAD